MLNALTEILDGNETPDYGENCFLGVKRGSKDDAIDSPPKRFEDARGSQRAVKRKDPVISEFRTLASLGGKMKLSKFTVEGTSLVRRAIDDGLPVEKILVTPGLLSDCSGKNLLNRMREENLMYYQVNDGVMGTLTTTRPVPSVIASVR